VAPQVSPWTSAQRDGGLASTTMSFFFRGIVMVLQRYFLTPSG
jgi:hypothetical protein